jgi:hypothetical protein
MSDILIHRISTVSGATPTVDQIELGEIQINTKDGKVFFAKSGTTKTVEQLISVNSTIDGNINFNGNVTANNFIGYLSGTSLNSDKLDGFNSTDFATVSGNTFNGNQNVIGNVTANNFIGYLSGTSLNSDKLDGFNSTDFATVSGNTFNGNQNINGNVKISKNLTILPSNETIDTNIDSNVINVKNDTGDLLFTKVKDGFLDVVNLKWLEGNLYTGLLSGGLISATVSGTTFNISAGTGIVVTLNTGISKDFDTTIKYVKWNNITNIPLTYLTTHIQSFIAIDSNGNVVQSDAPYYNGQYNSLITIGTVIHQNFTFVNSSITYPNTAYGYKQRTYDFIKAFGPLKLNGLNIIPTNSLGLNISQGTAWADGRNYQNDPNNPSYITDTGTTVSKIFKYYQVSGNTFIQDTNNNLGYTTIDPTLYNLNGVLTTVPGTGSNRQWTIQRVFWYPNSATKGIVVYYGNKYYNSSTDAAANNQYEEFYEIENTKQNAVYLGAIVLRNNAVFTDSTSYLLLPAGIFRSVGGGGGGGGIIVSTKLQDLNDVAVGTIIDGDLLFYNHSIDKWVHGKSLTGNFNITGDLSVTGNITGSIPYSGLTNVPSTIVTGSTQIFLTGTTGFSTYINQPLLTTSNVTFNNITSNGILYGNKILIGTTTDVGNNSKLQVSGLTYFNGNVLIGTTSDNGYKLDVNGIIRTTSDSYFATTSGNVGIGTTSPTEKLNVTGNILASGTILGSNLSGTNSGDNAVNSLYSGLTSNATHTGDVTGSTVLTLATVNSNVGTFGTSTIIPSFTVNAKGLITSVSGNTIPTSNSTTLGLLSSTDWNTFNNKQSALTNPVTGTGTANYLTKFTGTSAIGNSVIYENGGNIGIGTISPNATSILDITSTTKGFLPPRMTTTQKNVISSPATGLTVYDTDNNRLEVYNGSTWGSLGGATWGAITGTLSGQTDLQNALNLKQDVLNGTGFVKANGTTITYDNSTYLTTSSASSTYAPLASPSLTGDIIISPLGTININADASSTIYQRFKWYVYNPSGGTIGANSKLVLETTRRAGFTVSYNPIVINQGNVGINVSDLDNEPSKTLSVGGDIKLTGQFFVNTSVNSYTVGNVLSVASGGGIVGVNLSTTYAPINNPTFTGTVTAPTIANTLGGNFATTSGNVGIGTVSPLSKLHVNGFGTFTSGIVGVGGLTMYGDNTSSTGITLLTNGNLGIGTASPSEKLDIVGNIKTTGGLRIGAFIETPTNTDFTHNAYYSGGWKYRTNGYAMDTYQDGSGNYQIYMANSGSTNSAITFNPRFTVTNTGNVLIGTTIDTGEKLQVNGTSRFIGSIISNGGGGRYTNTSIGENALYSNTTGGDNIAIGISALYSNTQGNYNTSIGTYALASNTNGFSNTANGSYVLNSNTTGNQNTANGVNALYSNTTGSYGVAIGFSSLSNSLASFNVGIGAQAGNNITTGSYNTIVGHNTGLGITTGSSNTIIGSNVTGLTATLSNNIIIADGSGNRRINVDNNGNVGIGTTSPAFGGTSSTSIRKYLSIKGDTEIGAIQLATGASDGDNVTIGNLEFIDLNQSGADKRVGWISMAQSGTIAGNRGTYLRFATKLDGGTISEQLRIIGNGNVGIGNIAPVNKLDIYTNTDGDGLRIFNNVQSPSILMNSGHASGRNYAFSTNYFNFGDFNILSSTSAGGNATTGILTISSTGNIGIGTTAPSYRLDVKGGNASTARFDNGGQEYTEVILANNAIAKGTLLYTNSINDLSIRNKTAGTLSFGTNDVTRMTMFANGNIGIGTASPSYKLDIQGSGIVTQRILSTDNQVNFSLQGTFGQLSNEVGDFYINNNSASGNMLFRVGSTVERMRISSTGNVGIGTTSPSSKLQISGAAITSAPTLGASTGGALYVTNTDTAYGLLIGVSGSGSPWLQGQRTDASATAYSLNLQPSGGNVLIGTSTDSGHRLNVSGTINSSTSYSIGGVSILYGSANDSYANIRVIQNVSTTNQDGMYVNYNSTGTSGAHLRFFANGTNERMRIDASTGNVGIGYSSPSARLDLYSATDLGLGANGIRVQRPGSYGQYGYLEYLFGSSNTILGSLYTGGGASVFGTITFRQHSSTTYRDPVTINSDGNVGIGTTSPGSKLEINGVLANTLALDIRANSTTSQSFGTRIYAGSNSGDYSFRIRNVADTQDIIYIRGDGNVGIGTSSPSALLHVAGITFIDDNQIVSIINDTFTTDGITTPHYGLRWIKPTSEIGRVMFQSGYFGIRYFTGGVERMRISQSGNVGIGTSSPLSTFNIAGTSALNWIGGGNSTALATIGTGGTTGGSLWINTASLNTSFHSGLGINGVYSNPGGVGTSIVNIGAYGVNSGGGYGSALAFITTVGVTATERMRIFSNGNIGIGTTTDNGYILNVNGASYIGGGIITTGYIYMNNGGIIQAKDTLGAYQSVLYGRFSDNATYLDGGTGGLHLRTNNGAVYAMYMNTAGNVGIGTTSPNAPLQFASTTATRKIVLYESGNNNFQFYGFGINDGAMVYYVGNTGASHIFRAGTSTTTDVELMRISGNGNVGIGTNSPSSKLHVKGNLIIGDPSSLVADNYIRFYNSSGTAGLYGSLSCSNGNVHLDSGAGAFPLYINYYSGTGGVVFGNGASGGSGASVNASGQVTSTFLYSYKSVTTAQPLARLETTGTGGRPYMDFRAEGSDLGYVGFGGTSSNVMYMMHYLNSDIQIGTSSLVRMAIKGNGNVIIGSTTDGGFKLDVTGTLRTTSNHINQGYLKVTNGIISGDNGRFFAPQGASYVTQASVVTGAFKIKLPVAKFNSGTMMRMTIKIYTYNTGRSYSFDVGGYNLNSTWYNTFATSSTDSGVLLNVRFGVDATSNCIWIGEVGTAWDYPQVYVTDFQGGFVGYDEAWSSGWSITTVTAFDTVTVTRTSALGLNSTNNAFAYNLNQNLRTTDSPTFSSVNANATSANFLNSSNYIIRGGSSGNLNTDFQNTTAGSFRYQGDDASLTNSPGGSWWIYQNMRHVNTSNFWGTQVAWGWEDNANKLATRNVQSGTFGAWVYYLNSSNYNSYSPTLTGTGASGTWGINVTGNASTATNLSGGGGSFIQSTTVGTSYGAHYQIREKTGGGSVSGFTYAPALAFHWAGIVASSIAMESSGRIAIMDNPGTGYQSLIAQNIHFTNYLFGNGKQAFDTTDSYLRLNQTNGFTSGIYTPYNFRADGTIYVGGVTYYIGGGTSNLNGITCVSITETSSERYKENIYTLNNALDKVTSLRGVEYNRKGNIDKEIGIIAEEVAMILPEVIKYNNEGQPDSVSYGRLSAIFIEAFKQQQEQIELLKKEINLLKQ